MKETKKNQIPNLLSDDPVKDDSYGSHQKVADAICDVIMNEDEPKSISLAGNWGSGKSSIIQMLGKNLENKCYVFVFDAWEHEGDPLRISFLEKFIDFFSKTVPPLINNKKSLEDLDELKGLKQNIEEINIPIFNIRNVVTIILLALIVLFVSEIKFETDTNGNYNYLPIILACSTLGFAILYLFINPLFHFINRKKKDCKYKSLLKEEFANILKFSIKKDGFDNRKVIYKTKEATSIEFQLRFKSLLQEFQINNKEKNKLLIVIDNLDRIERDDALKMWSTMRTFFVENPSISQNSYIKPWLLVPYDFSGIQKLWKKGKINKDANSDEKTLETNEMNLENKDAQDKKVEDNESIKIEKRNLDELKYDIDNDDLADSFTDKSFQIKFDVPPPILSNWIDEFKKLLKITLIKINNTESSKIISLYRIINNTHEMPPTPRQIKLFINNLIPLYLQNKKIPIHILALYILSRKVFKNDDKLFIKFLQNPELLKAFKDIKGYLKSGFQEYLTSVFFNVPVDVASQILIKDKLNKSIEEFDVEELDRLKDLKINIVTDDIIREITNNLNANPSRIFNTIKSLDHIQKNNQATEYIPSWELIYRSFENDLKFGEIKEGDAEVFDIIKLNIPDGNKFEQTITNLIVSILDSRDMRMDNPSLNYKPDKIPGDFITYLYFLYYSIEYIIDNLNSKLIEENFKFVYPPLRYLILF